MFRISSLSIVALLALASCQPHQSNHSVVPQNWIAPSHDEPIATPEFENAVDRILDTHSEMLDQTDAPKGKWRLSSTMLELAVSTKGLIGILTGEGEATVQITWTRPDLVKKKSSPSEKTPHTIRLTSTDTDETLQKNADQLSRLAIATGKIRDPDALRSNLKLQFEQFSQTGKLIDYAQLHNEGWKPVEFRQTLAITAEGEVAPGIAVGGLLEFELRWKIVDRSSDEAMMAPSLAKKKRSLERVLGTLIEDFRAAESDIGPSYEKNGLELESIYIQLGVGGEVDFGIARSSTQSLGTMVFSKQKDAPVVAKSSPNSFVDIITESDGPLTLTTEAISSRHKTHRAPRSVFRKGLKRAMKMGRFFAKRSARVRNRKWMIQEIQPEFELNANGTVGVATIEGTVGFSLSYERGEDK